MGLLDLFGTKRPWIRPRARLARFTGEQDGPAERVFKAQLIGIFEAYPGLSRAYLARAEYEPRRVPGVVLALLATGGQQEAIVTDVARAFKGSFGADQLIEVQFLGKDQLDEIAAVCPPFFEARSVPD